jgi:hypothetical protein
MHKNATKCNETLSKWCKNKHGASKIMDTLETYHYLMEWVHKHLLRWQHEICQGNGGDAVSFNLVGNFSKLDRNRKVQGSEELDCLHYYDEALFKEGWLWEAHMSMKWESFDFQNHGSSLAWKDAYHMIRSYGSSCAWRIHTMFELIRTSSTDKRRGDNDQWSVKDHARNGIPMDGVVATTEDSKRLTERPLATLLLIFFLMF